MTTSSRWKEQGIEEEIEEGDEEFYESLDRIVSCSSSSCSSDNDEGGGGPYIHRRRRSGGSGVGGRLRKGDDSAAAAALRFSMAALSMYDVWVAEPASVQERRQRLLRHLGLASDRTLARLNSSVAPYPVADDDGVVGGRADACPGRRSASCDQLAPDSPTKADELAIARSSSDGAVSSAATAVHRNYYHHHHLCDVDDHHRSSGGINGPSPAPSKPPSGKFSRRSGEIGKSLFNSDSPFAAGSSAESGHHQRLEDDSDSVLSGDHDQGVCTIKNLDNGEKFVVNELGEDGTWNKLQQVGTGRQLTGEEFQMCVVGHSPIVQELMRRQNVEEGGGKRDGTADSAVDGGSSRSGPKAKKRGGGWLRSLKNVASSVTGHHSWERRSSDEKDTSSEKGGRRSSSATDDSQDVSSHAPEKTKVRHYGKSCKDLTALYMSQEIQAHNGCIWSIKFSLDGRYLASAGEDRVIHVWQVVESERRGELAPDKLDEGASASPEPALALLNGEAAHMEKKRRRKISYGRKSLNLDHVIVPENVFALSEKPLCSFRGHLADVLDLSWSKSEYLLSSSMDKTVRLWHMSNKSCLKIFSHSDYVTCIQFNPVDDRYFISGSLDAKVRIWSIPERQVVDWNDLHEMVTAACYTPDGQGALVGSHKGSCHLYSTSDNKLHQECQIDLQRRKKKSYIKKITGFQFAPGSSSEVLITSADSRARVVDGVDLVHKFKGFRNTSSQISASWTSNGKYVVCASEDSHVYVWRCDDDARPNRGKAVTVTKSYEHFHCEDVSVAVPWPGIVQSDETSDSANQHRNSAGNHLESAFSSGTHDGVERLRSESNGSPLYRATAPHSNGGTFFSDGDTLTWPEDKLIVTTTYDKHLPLRNGSHGGGSSAWGMVIVTAGLGGEIKTYQNFGLSIPV